MQKKFRPALGALLLGLAGCAGNGAMVTNENYGSYSQSLFSSVAGGRDLAVVVVGGVAGLDRRTLEQAVERGLTGAGPATHVNFTTHPGLTAARDYRIVLLFGGGGGAGGEAVCKGARPLSPASATISIAAAFCYRDEALSSVNARSLAPANTPEAVTRTVSELSPILLPDENPYYRPDANDDFDSH